MREAEAAFLGILDFTFFFAGFLRVWWGRRKGKWVGSDLGQGLNGIGSGYWNWVGCLKNWVGLISVGLLQKTFGPGH